MTNATLSEPHIKTCFLILSDTHGMSSFPAEVRPARHADVAIHCGDLTNESKLDEFLASIRLLRNIDAPLKLVIAGNHDFTLDTPVFKKKVAEARPALEPDLVVKEYGYYGEARQLFQSEEVKAAGIVLLDEGTHHFNLQNGASLTVYASPWTPSLGGGSGGGGWGFQYHPDQGGHNFTIENGVDVVITHGPPKGIMDYTDCRQRAGCSKLFAAIARVRPRMHCFGHIHEGWGAKLVTWRDRQLTDTTTTPSSSHLVDIDNAKSVVIAKLSSLKPSKFDTPESIQEKLTKREYHHSQNNGYYTTSHCTGDANPLQCGRQTLFVNAAIQGSEDFPWQMPWLIDIDLPKG